MKEAADKLKGEKDPAARAKLAEELAEATSEQKKTWDESNRAFKGGKDGYQTGQLGVDLACASNNLRNQDRVSLTANRQVQRPQRAWRSAASGSTTPTRPTRSPHGEGSERRVLPHPGEAPAR